MIAGQVAGKATRDALFLANFHVTAIPAMVVIAGAVSLAVVLLASRMMALEGPKRTVLPAFLASGLGLLAEWYLYFDHPQAATVLVYLHETVAGPILISGFWSIVIDTGGPLDARKSISYFGCAGTVGGVIGCILAQWIAGALPVTTMLPLLALFHLLCACFVGGLKSGSNERLKEEERTAAIEAESRAFGFAFRVVRRTSYARNLALLTLLSASIAVLVNYVLKVRVAEAYRGEELLRFFAVFYMIASILTFAVQTSLSRLFLSRLGGARTAASLPAVVGVSSLLGVIFPGLTSAVIAGGAESVLRNSVFRAGYETLFVPVSRRIKRSTKSIVDVGFDRIGSVIGGGMVELLIFSGSGSTGVLILVAASVTSLLAFVVAVRLRHGYLDALEKRLMHYSSTIEPSSFGLPVRHGTDTARVAEKLNPLEFVAVVRGFQVAGTKPDPFPRPTAPQSRPKLRKRDPVGERFVRLRSGKPNVVKSALGGGTLDPVLAPLAIQLLACPEVSEEALESLQKTAPLITGALGDALLNSNNPWKVRCLVSRALASGSSARAAEGLIAGLRDPHFDVRFQCGRALARLRIENPGITVAPDVVYAALRSELEGDGFGGERRRLLERPDASYLSEGMPPDQVDWSLEHVFMVLSLVVPREPLKIAFRGLHSSEDAVRGTAIEYLEGVLPGPIRSQLLTAVGRIARQS